MDEFIAQTQKLVANTDEAGRKKVLDILRDTMYALENQDDTVGRVMFLNLQIATVRIGVDLQLFQHLRNSESPLTTAQLAGKTRADPVLLARVLRYLASTGYIKETGKDAFTATNITQTLADTGIQAGVHHYFDFLGPIFQALPDYLEGNGYQNVTDHARSPLHYAWKTDLPPWEWFMTQPKKQSYFNTWMSKQREGLPTWLSVFPIEAKAKGWNPHDPVFVDVGGGIGHECAALKAKYPNLPGRVILQDSAPVLTQAITKQTDGIENMAQDFFQPQVVKAARFYYMRNVLHDHPDDKCRVILQNIKDVMGADSVILVDDIVLPNQGVHWQATQLDMVVMAGLAAMERTREQWDALIVSAGMRIEKVYTYTEPSFDSIIEVVKA